MANKQRKKRLNKSRRHISGQRSGDEMLRRDITCRVYQVRNDSLDVEARTIDAVIASEEPVLVFDMQRWEAVEEILRMDGVSLPDQVPFCDTHDGSSIVKQLGSTRNLRVEGGKLVATNHYASTPEGERAFTLTREGHLTDNSIGYRVTDYVTIEPGKTADIDGRSFTASPTRALRIARKWEVKENSACPIGADETAKNRQEPANAGKGEPVGGSNNNLDSRKESDQMDFKKWLEVRGLKYDDLGETQRTALKADFDAEQTRASLAVNGQRAGSDAIPPKKVDEEAIRAEGVALEQKRQADIREMAGSDVLPETVTRCISDNMTVDAARTVILEEVRSKQSSKINAPNIIISSGEITRNMLVDGMCLRAGLEIVISKEADGEKRLDQADKLRDLALIDVMRHALMIDGQTIPVGRDDTIRAAFSTASLPVLLGAVANKSLLKGYQMVEATWRQWCSVGSVSDFKTQTRARLTDTGELELVGNSGEVASGGATEEKEQFNIATYAKKFGITRQNIIDDDLGVFTQTPQRMGVKASLLISRLVYMHLLANGLMGDGKALFVAGHKNLNTGKPFNQANLKNAITKFRQQKDADNESISVPPKFLIIPPELEFDAYEFLQSESIVVAGGTDTVKGSKNTLKGKLTPIIEERLSNSDYAGSSAADWYVTGDKNQCDTLEVSFLNGKQTPTIERFVSDVDTMGIWYRVFMDAGVKAMDWRTMQKNKG